MVPVLENAGFSVGTLSAFSFLNSSSSDTTVTVPRSLISTAAISPVNLPACDYNTQTQ